MPTASLRALLLGSIDYAGLFPPANLELEPALENYGKYVRSDEVWMLGPFILPLKEFGSTSANLLPFDVEHRLRISALGPKSDNAADFGRALETAAEAIRSFNASHGATASVDQLEMPLPADGNAVNLAEASASLSKLNLSAFFESSIDHAERTIALLAEHQTSGAKTHFGMKLRTGGVIASAFPSSVQVARALVAAAKNQVPIKFTAGLHHPIRGFQKDVQLMMHGFLNVLGAGVLGAEHEWDVQQSAAMLEDENAESFHFDDEIFSWRDWSIAAGQIVARRALVTSLGSCSFDEPREDLRALGLL